MKEKSWSEQVNAILERTGWSQDEFARRIGRDSSTVSKWLSGANPKPSKSAMRGKAYGWVRVSSIKPGEEKFSPEAQEERIRDEAGRRKLELGGFFAALNVNSASIDRDGTWAKMCEALQPGDTVITNELTRIGRSTMDTLRRIEDLEGRDIEIVALDMPIDSSTPMGEAIRTIYAALAQAENKQRAERIRQSMSVMAKTGIWHGGPLPLGYRYGDKNGGERRPVEVDPAGADVVRRAFAMRSTGNSGRTIAKALRIDPTRVRRILETRTYIGEREYEGQVYPVDVPTIIDRVTWERVQAAGRGSNPLGRNRYLLSGALTCSLCGGMMTHSTTRGKADWVCRGRKVWGDCKGVSIREAKVEEFVIDQLFSRIETREEQYRKGVDAVLLHREDRTATISAHIAAVEDKQDRLLRLHLDGKLDEGQWQRETGVLKIEADALRDELEAEKAAEVLPARWEGNIRDDWELLTLDEKRQALRLFVESIAILPGSGTASERVLIRWKE